MTLLGELTKYCNDSLNDVVPSCQKKKWACQRFLNDLNRQGSKEFPYVFDEDKAGKFLTWMTFFKHTKGPLAGTYKIPHVYEKFVFGQIYGWVHKDTGLRRFRKAYIQVARKNAKSQDLGILALYEMSAFGEEAAEVYVAATKREQTRYVWEEADIIYHREEDLRDKFTTKYGEIIHKKSNSRFTRMSKDDKKAGDGSNPQCGILDEYHAHESTEYYDVLSSGMKSRRQPLLIIITTAGFDLSHPCYKDEYQYVSKLLNPSMEIDNDRYFAIVFELDKDEEGNVIDDLKDERAWLKCNPIVAETKEGIESIRDELKLAQDKPEKMRDFLTKTMDVWVNMRSSGYMNMDKWKACATDFPDVKGREVIAGLDLSAVLDLTSVGFEIELPDGTSAVMHHSFIPEDTLQTRMRQDAVPFDRWVAEGWITATPGAEVDYQYILDYMDEIYETNEWPKGEVCYDRIMATWLKQQLENRGYIPVETPQGMLTLSEPTKDFRAKVYSRKLIHQDDPVLNWAMGNAVVRKASNESIMLDKNKATERIDPVACLINAHTRARISEEESAYDTGGIKMI